MITIKPGYLSLSDLLSIYRKQDQVQLDPGARRAVDLACEQLQRVIQQGDTVYGVNTGFGLLANTKIPDSDLQQLQRNIVLSHAAGVGELLDDAVVALMMVLKVAALAQGYSGIRQQVIDYLMALYNGRYYPCVPGQGSVGASGDLSPLAHMAMVLLGEGEVRHDGQCMSAKEALVALGLEPLTLQAKEGLALLNGTQVSTAIALAALFDADRCFQMAVVTGSLCVDASAASDVPFSDCIHQAHGMAARIRLAGIYRELLDSSEIRDSHSDCDKVQDPYSLRCQVQVMGSCWHYLHHHAVTLLCEANAVTDNPLVFNEQDCIVSGGNFHAEAVALAADGIALVLAEIGSLSERRIAMLMDKQLSGLPAFLVKDSGLNSGFMLAQVTAAALVSENKMLAYPASVDSIPTSANQEDHVSMATHAARRTLNMAANATGVVAIELLAACQGLDLRLPLKTSPILQQIHQRVRQVIPAYEQDRFFAHDIEQAKTLIEQDAFANLLPGDLLQATVMCGSMSEGSA